MGQWEQRGGEGSAIKFTLKTDPNFRRVSVNTGNSGEIKHCGSVSWSNSCWLNLNSAVDDHVSLRGEYKGIQRDFFISLPKSLDDSFIF